MAAVVVRWYGGTNLGVGGLVRAYGGALARALEGAPTVRCERAAEVLIRYAHEQTSAVMRCVAAHGARDLDHAYGERGVELRCLVPLRQPARSQPAFATPPAAPSRRSELGESVIRAS